MSDQNANDPLHGQSLEKIVTQLVEHYGWSGLGERINIRCFNHDPSVTSSLKFLRKTPWARKEVEALFISLQTERGHHVVPERPKWHPVMRERPDE